MMNNIMGTNREILFNIWIIVAVCVFLPMNIAVYCNKISHRRCMWIMGIFTAIQSFVIPALFFPDKMTNSSVAWIAFPVEVIWIILALRTSSLKDKKINRDEENGITAITEKHIGIQKYEWLLKDDLQKAYWQNEYSKRKAQPLPWYVIIMISLISFMIGIVVMRS